MAKKIPEEPSKETPAVAPVTVQVAGQAICEDGVHHLKGATFQTTPDRAEALGTLVTLVAK
jgi:hypothetical protein